MATTTVPAGTSGVAGLAVTPGDPQVVSFAAGHPNAVEVTAAGAAVTVRVSDNDSNGTVVPAGQTRTVDARSAPQPLRVQLTATTPATATVNGLAAGGGYIADRPSTVAAAAVVAPISATQRLQLLIAQGLEDVSIVVLGDSTSAGATTWPRLMLTAIAALWPTHTVRYREWGTTAYGAPTTVRAGSGARFVDLYNGAVASTNTFHPLGADFDARVAAVQPTLIVVSHGHNEGITSTNRDVYTAAMITLLESLTDACPTSDLIVIGQNPETNNTNIQRASSAYRLIADQRGYGFISVLETFLADSRWAAGIGGIMTDTLHPNAAGQQLWADTVAPFFTTRSDALETVAPAPSTLTQAQRNLLTNGDLTAYATSPGAPDGWTAAGAPVVTKDAALIEDVTKGWSVKITGSGTAAGELYQDVDVSRVRGRVVTLVVRVYVPAASPTASGVIAIEDSTGTTASRSSAYGRDGWRWLAITRRVPVAATTCRVHLYGVNAAVAGSANVDRAALVYGRWPTRAA